MRKIKVLPVCSNVLFRKGVVQTLRNTEYIEPVADTGNGVEALRLIRDLAPDMVLVGRFLEDIESIEFIKRVKEANPSIQVLACSSSVEVKSILSLLQAGADGYLLEDTKPDSFVAAISAAYKGESILDPLILRALIGHVTCSCERQGGIPKHLLTEKEFQVLRLGAQGLMNKEIADRLNMSLSTVKAHWTAIFAKMGVNSRSQAVYRMISDGWLSTEDIMTPLTV